jgi:hypothetical protein
MASESGSVGQQRSEPPHPSEHRDVVNLDATVDQQFLNVAIGQMKRRYQRTATTITSGGNRNPADADFGGSHGRKRVDDFTAQVCLDHANSQRNGAGQTPNR